MLARREAGWHCGRCGLPLLCPAIPASPGWLRTRSKLPRSRRAKGCRRLRAAKPLSPCRVLLSSGRPPGCRGGWPGHRGRRASGLRSGPCGTTAGAKLHRPRGSPEGEGRRRGGAGYGRLRAEPRRAVPLLCRAAPARDAREARSPPRAAGTGGEKDTRGVPPLAGQ